MKEQSLEEKEEEMIDLRDSLITPKQNHIQIKQ
jgi:hypothetical protein